MKILLFANTAWYLFNFRRSLAEELRKAGHEVLLVSPPGPFGAELEALGFRWIPAPMIRRSLNPFRELGLVLWLRKLMLRERVELVHAFTIKCAVYGALAAKSAGVKGRVNAVAGMGYVFTSTEWRAKLLRPLVSSLLRLALGGRRARLILQNPDDVRFFEETRLAPREHIRLIAGSGVNCSRFVPAARSPGAPPTSAFRILLPGRLLWDKGIREYVDAAKMLHAHGNDVVFLLAGSPDQGNPASIPEEMLREWVEQRLVVWLGHVSDMPDLLNTVDAVVLPSYREGLPKGLIEAAACGVALITTDVPGCREVVTHEVDGLLVPAKDSHALAAAIRRLQLDAPLRVRLGNAARAKAMQHFDEQLVIRSTIAVYEELIPPHQLPTEVRAQFDIRPTIGEGR